MDSSFGTALPGLDLSRWSDWVSSQGPFQPIILWLCDMPGSVWGVYLTDTVEARKTNAAVSYEKEIHFQKSQFQFRSKSPKQHCLQLAGGRGLNCSSHRRLANDLRKEKSSFSKKPPFNSMGISFSGKSLIRLGNRTKYDGRLAFGRKSDIMFLQAFKNCDHPDNLKDMY